jgi:hypothetical protein
MLNHTGDLVVVAGRENEPLLIGEAGTHNDTRVSCHNCRLFMCPLHDLMVSIYVLKTLLLINILTSVETQFKRHKSYKRSSKLRRLKVVYSSVSAKIL